MTAPNLNNIQHYLNMLVEIAHVDHPAIDKDKLCELIDWLNDVVAEATTDFHKIADELVGKLVEGFDLPALTDIQSVDNKLVDQWLDWALARCQCDEEASAPDAARLLYDQTNEWPYVAHAPGMCECTNDLKLCQRAGKVLWLCSNCRVTGDEEVSERVQEFVKRHEFLHAEARRARIEDDLPVGQAKTNHVYVLIHDNGYEDTQVYGVYSTKQLAEEYVQEYVNDHEGEGKDDFRVECMTLDRLYND